MHSIRALAIPSAVAILLGLSIFPFSDSGAARWIVTFLIVAGSAGVIATAARLNRQPGAAMYLSSLIL